MNIKVIEHCQVSLLGKQCIKTPKMHMWVEQLCEPGHTRLTRFTGDTRCHWTLQQHSTVHNAFQTALGSYNLETCCFFDPLGVGEISNFSEAAVKLVCCCLDAKFQADKRNLVMRGLVLMEIVDMD